MPVTSDPGAEVITADGLRNTSSRIVERRENVTSLTRHTKPSEPVRRGETYAQWQDAKLTAMGADLVAADDDEDDDHEGQEALPAGAVSSDIISPPISNYSIQ